MVLRGGGFNLVKRHERGRSRQWWDAHHNSGGRKNVLAFSYTSTLQASGSSIVRTVLAMSSAEEVGAWEKDT